MPVVKILLLSVTNDRITHNIEDIGICCIAAFMRQKGFQVMVQRVKENLLDYDRILKYSPGIIGVSIYTLSKESVYRTAAKLKQLLPGVVICAGGPLPTYMYSEVLAECPAIDFVVRGEGEFTFLELAEQLPGPALEQLKNIKGLAYREGDQVKANENRSLIEDINILPMPAKDILKDNKLKTAQLSTSRGCFSRCTFCVSGLFWKKWRGRNAANVLAEIEYIVNNFHIRAFNFCDASFEDPGHHYDRMADIARGIIARQLNISYFADIRAEFHRKASNELMQLLKDSGLCGVCVGIESANQQDMKLYGKLARVEDNTKFIQLFRQYEINVDPGFINFNPYSNFDRLDKNIKFLEKYNYASNFDYIRSSFKMFKGTPLYLKVKRDGLLENPISSETGYRFTDQRVERLSKYIEEYLQKIDAETGFAINRLSYYTCSYFNLLFHLKRQFLLAHEAEGHQITASCEETHKTLLKPANSQVAAWFRKLLQLAEKDWNNEKAHSISQQLLSTDYINKTVGTLEKNKVKLYRKLINLHLDPYIIEVR